MTALRYAIFGWAAVLVSGLLLFVGAALEPSREAPGVADGCEALGPAEAGAVPAGAGCPTVASPETSRPAGLPSTGEVRVELLAAGVLLGVVSNVFAIARGRPLAATDARARLGVRLGLLALALLLGLPLLIGAAITLRLAGTSP